MNLLTAKQIAAAWQMPLARVYELARLGVLPSVKLGERQIRFEEAAIREFLARGGASQPNGRTLTQEALGGGGVG